MPVRQVDTSTTPLPPKKVAPFYLSTEWRSLVANVKRIRGERCEDPEHQGQRVMVGRRLFADHVVELRDGGAPLDPRNIMLRCGSCHTRKTMRERTARRGV